MAIRWETVGADPEEIVARVADDMGQDWVKDSIYRSETLDLLKRHPDRIHRRLEEGALPRRGLPIPVPKSSLTIRPAVDLRVVDRVSYQMLVETFSVELLRDLPTFVSGWRYKDNPAGPQDLMDNGKEWRFYQQQLLAEWNQGCDFVLGIDIAGFFQTIPHRVLAEALVGVRPEAKRLLMEYLRIWNPLGVGLPQRVLGSSLLANLYLEPVDEILADYRAARWMDDVFVFCGTRREGVQAALRIQDAMIQLNLQFNVQKTFLLRSEDAEPRVVDFFRLNGIEYQLDFGVPGDGVYEAGTEGLDVVWSELMDDPDNADRTKYSFCVTRFIEHDINEPVDDVLRVLTHTPHVADHAGRFLREHLGDPDVLDRTTTFLRSRSNLFGWQEHRLAPLYWHADELSREQLRFVRRRAASQAAFWPARAVYFRALAKNGTRQDARNLAELAERESGEIRRALVIAGFESGHLTNGRLATMARDDEDAKEALSFLKNRGQVPALSF